MNRKRHPEDAAYPVTLERIERAVCLTGHDPIPTSRHIIVTHDVAADTIISASKDATDTSNCSHLKAYSADTFHIITKHQGQLNFDELNEIVEFINEWNHDCLTPTLMVDYDDPDDVRITGTTVLGSQCGMTDNQLNFAIDQALNNATVFIRDLQHRFPAVSLPGINDILFAFMLDNGPSLVIKGHWDPDIDARDFLRVFLICNEFNELSDDCVAYCHRGPEGLWAFFFCSFILAPADAMA